MAKVSEYHAWFAEQLIVALEKDMGAVAEAVGAGPAGPAAELLDGSELPGRQRDAPGDSGAGAGATRTRGGAASIRSKRQAGVSGRHARGTDDASQRRPGPAAAAEALRLPVRPLGDYVPGGRVDAMRRLLGGR